MCQDDEHSWQRAPPHLIDDANIKVCILDLPTTRSMARGENDLSTSNDVLDNVGFPHAVSMLHADIASSTTTTFPRNPHHSLLPQLLDIVPLLPPIPPPQPPLLTFLLPEIFQTPFNFVFHVLDDIRFRRRSGLVVECPGEEIAGYSRRVTESE